MFLWCLKRHQHPVSLILFHLTAASSFPPIRQTPALTTTPTDAKTEREGEFVLPELALRRGNCWREIAAPNSVRKVAVSSSSSVGEKPRGSGGKREGERADILTVGMCVANAAFLPQRSGQKCAYRFFSLSSLSASELLHFSSIYEQLSTYSYNTHIFTEFIFRDLLVLSPCTRLLFFGSCKRHIKRQKEKNSCFPGGGHSGGK